ncbi:MULTISPECIES: transporter substrate-binding domain-containing protein [Variovorax]|jgi:polar amino acid transport system substrate-binding protein|uniref:transporter substrate-binding domain-containing protein n=1 Tax=Variovorax TaxID=34072 RepID=UPI00086A6F51|nr:MULTISPECIES: transporter substrate-binding domain-containing protein [Variovorax]MBN8753546.1 transporter substrate-binding domain-containing protein [Variovorax sp.]ODU12967.1 MAG: amino acid ABC transporter [Variovorax sp. SCN 67-85]ODV27501.1 MAG: amino acid ABC transporter [Variovorax sp. SCN 67-20]OJZ12193.1 MAG: amino acid ABC transporter [Variovorax sp. 67-131]UKI05970.1 transporter substrate-binding domain-containing protein [Variovorax paradoxus]
MKLGTTFTRTCVALALVAGVAQAAMADQLDDIKKAGKVRVAIAMGTPLFSFADANLQPTGSDVDTATALAKDLGVKLEIVSITNAARVPTLQAQRADLVIADLSITPEREKVVDFSVPYAVISIIVGGPKSIKVTDYADLNGKRIGLTRATVNDTLTTQQAKGAEIVRYEDDATLITSMVTGQIDLFSSTPSNLSEMVKQAPAKNLELKFAQKDFDLGIALNKEQPKLKEWVNNWVVTNQKNGKLNAIYKKYHGRDLPERITKL